jgi:hypothetical protein
MSYQTEILLNKIYSLLVNNVTAKEQNKNYVNGYIQVYSPVFITFLGIINVSVQ